MRKFILYASAFIVIFLVVPYARAATLFVAPPGGEHPLNTTINVEVRVQSIDKSINAVEGELRFDPAQVTVVGVEKTGSVMSVWMEEPRISNEDGTIKFSGVILNPGFLGPSGLIMTVRLKPKLIGTTAISFSNGAVLANDGNGSNVLTALTGGIYTIVPFRPGFAPVIPIPVVSSTPIPNSSAIIPPRIDYVDPFVYLGEGGIKIQGIAPVNASVVLVVKNTAGRVTYSTLVPSDKNGGWNGVIEPPMRFGKYKIEAMIQSADGVTSLPAISDLISVQKKPLLAFFGYEVGEIPFFVTLLAILGGAFMVWRFLVSAWRRQVERKAVIAQRDIMSLSNLMKQDLQFLRDHEALNHVPQEHAQELQVRLQKLDEHIEKMQKYVIESVGEIPE